MHKETHSHLHTHVHTYICTHRHSCTCAYTYIQMHTHAHKHMHTHTTYSIIHTHTHVHTHHIYHLSQLDQLRSQQQMESASKYYQLERKEKPRRLESWRQVLEVLPGIQWGTAAGDSQYQPELTVGERDRQTAPVFSCSLMGEYQRERAAFVMQHCMCNSILQTENKTNTSN